MYKTVIFHIGRLFCFSMAAPSPFVYLNSFINSNHTYSSQGSRSNSIPRMAYIPFAMKLATLAYACSSWTKASLILQQQFQIVTTKSILTENEKKLISGLHISVTYILLRLFHQKSTVINLKKGGRFEKLNLFSSKLLIPLVIGLIICTIIEESTLMILLQITSGSRRVYSISGKNAIKAAGFRDDVANNSKKENILFKQDIENKLNESYRKSTENLKSSHESLSHSRNSLSICTEKKPEIDKDLKNEKEENKKCNDKDENSKETHESSKIFYHDDCCVCLGSCDYPQMETFCASESHVAHTQCMLKWLQASKKRQCPLCRQPLQVYIMSESMHDYIYGYPPLYQILQRNIDWKCFLKRTGITLSVASSLLVILELRMLTNRCKYTNLHYSSSN
ncbi:hypothetical protein BCR36DRAFT_331571, partial [Piromyces finnis]